MLCFFVMNIKNYFPKTTSMGTVKKENKFAKGAIILLLSALVCKVIGALYRIPLSNILGAEGIGLYQLIFPVYSLFLIFSSGGIPVALSKLVASCRAKGEEKRAKRFLFQSIILLLSISVVFALMFIFLGKQIASFQGNVQARLGYVAVGIAIVFASVLTGLRGYFQGYQNMTPTAISQIIEQFLKLILGLTFAFLLMPKGTTYGVFGAIMGVAVSELVAFVYLALSFLFKRKKADVLSIETSTKFSEDFKTLLKLAFPITLSSSIFPLILAVDSFLIVNLLLSNGMTSLESTQVFGVYSGMVNSLVNFPTVVSMALAVSLIPEISYAEERGEKANLGAIFKIVFFISIPCVFIYFAFSREIIAVLYPNATNPALLNLGSSLLRIMAINIFYISLLQLSTSILQAKNKSLTSLMNLTVAGVTKVLLTVVFVSSPLGIYGAGVASIMCYAIACGLNVVALRGEIDFGIDLKQTALVFLNSFFALGIAIGFNYLFNLVFSGFVSILLSLCIAGIFYVFMSLLLPIFSKEELQKIPFGSKICVIREKFVAKFKIKKKS